MRFVTRIVRECQHVSRFPDADPAHQILSKRQPRWWRRPTGRPRASWLQYWDGQGICLGNGQTEAPGDPAESGCSDALLRCMLPYLSWPVVLHSYITLCGLVMLRGLALPH